MKVGPQATPSEHGMDCLMERDLANWGRLSRGDSGAEAPPVPGLSRPSTGIPDCITLAAAWEALTCGSGASVFVVNSEFMHVYVNQYGAESVGLQPNQMIGTPMGGHVSDALTDIVKSIIGKALDSGEPMVQGFLFQGQLRQTNFVPIRSQSGAFEHVLIISHLVCEKPPDMEAMQPLLSAEHTRAEALGPLARLTKRELEILKFIGDGTRTVEIAERLGLSQRTVHNHCASISKKLGHTTRAEMARLAIRAGLSSGAGVVTNGPPRPGSRRRHKACPERGL